MSGTRRAARGSQRIAFAAHLNLRHRFLKASDGFTPPVARVSTRRPQSHRHAAAFEPSVRVFEHRAQEALPRGQLELEGEPIRGGSLLTRSR